jgi:hypothetical protein
LIKFFWVTGYGFLLLTIILNINYKKFKFKSSDLFIIVQLIFSIIFLWITKYDKHYYILIILPSIFIFSSYFFEKIKFENLRFLKFFLINYLIIICVWGIFFIKDVLRSKSYEVLFLKNEDEQRIFVHNNNPQIKNTYKFIIDNNIKDIFVICSETSDNFYLNIKKPRVSLNGWLYTSPGYNHQNFLDHYHELISKNSGFIFFVNKICMSEGRPTTKYFKNLISKSTHIKHDGYYHVRALK